MKNIFKNPILFILCLPFILAYYFIYGIGLILYLLIKGIITLIINLKNKNKKDKNYNYKYNYNEEKLKLDYSNVNFYKEQWGKCTNCEKEYYDLLYNLFGNSYKIKTQVYLRSMFPKMKAPNNRIDIVFFDKNYDYPILLIEIQDSSHKSHARAQSDKGLKDFCENNNIKLQKLYTTFGCNGKSIKNLINKKLAE